LGEGAVEKEQGVEAEPGDYPLEAVRRVSRGRVFLEEGHLLQRSKARRGRRRPVVSSSDQ